MSRFYVYESPDKKSWRVADTAQNEPSSVNKDYIVAECRSEGYARQIAELLSKASPLRHSTPPLTRSAEG